jgi:hypothetical protein
VVHRSARCRLRATRAQRNRVFGLLASAGDVWCAVLELNRWRRARQDAPLAGYQELRRYSDAWFTAAKRRRTGDARARFPRRKRGLVPVRWYAGTFTLNGRVLRIPVARGCAPLLVRLDRDVPYPAGQVRSVTLGFDAGTSAGSAWSRAGTRGGSGRPSTRPPGSSWPGRSSIGRGCWRSATRAASSSSTRAGGITSGPGTGAPGTSSQP